MQRRTPRQEVHLALTICTLGLWAPCWLITVIAARWEPWRCTRCRRLLTRTLLPEDALVSASDGTTERASLGLVHERLD